MRWFVAATLALSVGAAACTGETERGSGVTDASTSREPSTTRAAVGVTDGDPSSSTTPAPIVGRTNQQASGNRYVEGAASLMEPPALEVDVGGEIRWLLGLEPGDDAIIGDVAWVAVDHDGRPTAVAADGTIRADVLIDASTNAVYAPVLRTNGTTLRLDDAPGAESRLPGALVVDDGNGVRAWLDDPTNRYAHAVLGDDLEAAQIVIEHANGSGPTRTTITLTDTVVEGLAPMLIDLDGDGVSEVVVTESNRDVGARLVVYDASGERVARSEAIGVGNRWRHQIAAAPTAPDGGLELIDVQTPHIGGIVQFHRLEGDRLVKATGTSPFRSHVLGSTNLDMAVVVDADGDGRPDVVIPSQGLQSLVAIQRNEGSTSVLAEHDVDGTISSNIATRTTPRGVGVAVATDDGRVLIWPAP